jgi:hypothetical protein
VWTRPALSIRELGCYRRASGAREGKFPNSGKRSAKLIVVRLGSGIAQ